MSFAVGKWTQQTCRKMVEKLSYRMKLPSPDSKIEIYTDGNDDYEHVLPEYYAGTCIDYGQIIKIKKGGRVVDKIKRIIFGTPYLGDIETTNIENFNGILRERIGRLVRKTKCFSKYKRRLICAINLFQFYWDFMNNFKRGTTPAMLEGIADKPWTWHDFFYFKLNIAN